MSLSAVLGRPDVWRGGAPVGAASSGIPTGFAALDARLPWRGWPQGCVTELLCDGAAGGLRLLLPALARRSAERREEARWLVWIAPPHIPYAPALNAAGVNLSRVLWVRPETPEDAVWAATQALRCGGAAAVLAWLDKPSGRVLRQLQLAAETGRSWGVLFRPTAEAVLSSPAALRLLLSPAHEGCSVRILKCRGGASGGTVHVPTASA